MRKGWKNGKKKKEEGKTGERVSTRTFKKVEYRRGESGSWAGQRGARERGKAQAEVEHGSSKNFENPRRRDGRKEVEGRQRIKGEGLKS